jgi:hypothetical protein
MDLNSPDTLKKLKIGRRFISAGTEAIAGDQTKYDNLLHAAACAKTREVVAKENLKFDEETILASGRVTANEWANRAKLSQNEASSATVGNDAYQKPTKEKKTKRPGGMSVALSMAAGSTSDLARKAMAPLSPREADPIDGFMTLSSQALGIGQIAFQSAKNSAQANWIPQGRVKLTERPLNINIFELDSQERMVGRTHRLGPDTDTIRQFLAANVHPDQMKQLDTRAALIGRDMLTGMLVKEGSLSEASKKGLMSAAEHLERLSDNGVHQNRIITVISHRQADDPLLMNMATSRLQRQVQRAGPTASRRTTRSRPDNGYSR